MHPIWGYVLVAVTIAVFAFVIGQFLPGAGIVFAALASTMWTAYSANRVRHLRTGC